MKKTILALAASTLLLAACGEIPQAPQENKLNQANKAAEAAASIQFSENAEIENIKRRLQLTSNPGQLGFILLLNETGQPVAYLSVKGKITSGSKRLTSSQQIVTADCGDSYCDQIREAPSDEGTFGSSDPYIFWFGTDGAYHQWNGKYLYSDKPFRVSIKPLVIDSATIDQ